MSNGIAQNAARKQEGNGTATTFLRAFGAKLDALIKERGLSVAQVAKDAKVSRRALFTYTAGKSAPGAEALARLCRLLQADPAELLDVYGAYVGVKLYATKVSGGHGRVVESEEPVEEIHFRRTFLKARNKKPENIGAFQVEGSSMEPQINHGDVVLFDRAQTKPTDGLPFVVRVGDSLQVKILQKTAGNDVLLWGRDTLGQEKLYDTAKPEDFSSRRVEIVGRVFWRGGEV